jgi:hypothetical protein
MKIERPLEDLAEILGTRPSDWLLPFASIAVHAGEAAGERRADVASRGPRRQRRIEIDITDPASSDENDRIDIGLSWQTAGFRWVFPSFDGHIVVVRDAPSSCVVTIEGSYRIPNSARDAGAARAVSLAADTSATMLLSTLRTAVEEQARLDA